MSVVTVLILHDRDRHRAALYNDATGEAFGYVASDCECGLEANQILASFLAYCETAEVRDIRRCSRIDLERLWGDFMADEHSHDQRASA